MTTYRPRKPPGGSTTTARFVTADRAVALSAIVAFVAALVITAASGVPAPVPGIALGSVPLFYIERGVATFAALVVAASLLTRGLRGELPSQVSTTGLTYPESLERAVTGSDEAIGALAARVDRLDGDLRKRDEMLRLLADQILALTTQIERGHDAGQMPGE